MIGILFGLVFPSFATWLYFIVLHGRAGVNVIYTVCKVAQFTFPLVFSVLYKTRRLEWKAPDKKDLQRGILFGLLASLGILGGFLLLQSYPLVEGLKLSIVEKMNGYGLHNRFQFLALAVGYSAFHSFLEEYYWRGFLFGELKRRMPVAAAIAISSLGFMAHHVLIIGGFLHSYGVGTWIASLCIAAAGAFWCGIFSRNQSLVGSWVSHAIVDSALMGVGYFLWFH